MPGGAIPDAGGTIAALEHMTDRRVELLAGKPSNLITSVALQKLDLPPRQVIMVGDRLETDIRMGQSAGMYTAVTLSGASKREDVERMISPPDFVLENIGELPAVLSAML
jgi:arabinose operon protein AraL